MCGVCRLFWVLFVLCLFLGFDVLNQLKKKSRRRNRRRIIPGCENGKTGKGSLSCRWTKAGLNQDLRITMKQMYQVWKGSNVSVANYILI